MTLFIGLMSGTSMDGIDAALVDVLGGNTLIAGSIRPYRDEVMFFLRAVLEQERVRPSELSQLNTLLGREFAASVNELLAKTGTKPQDVVAIGSHGQTICHDATAAVPYTVQLGCAHVIAESTGIRTVADFRTRDLVIGGQGAPFAPMYHQALFGETRAPLVVVNLGGIANLTYLTPDGRVTGYDVGPGNCLMDAWAKRHLGCDYDVNGVWAGSGEVIVPLLMALLDDPFFKRLPPKSIGKEYFSIAWLLPYLEPSYSPKDVQATLMACTVSAIASDIQRWSLTPKWVIICGGGVHNTCLQTALMKQLPDFPIKSTQAFGIDPDFVEAMMLAWLAERAVSQMPLDLKQTTGAQHPTIYGAIYPAGIDKGKTSKV
jgi:anhydro-N-acetylmuramic acid kinase